VRKTDKIIHTWSSAGIETVKQNASTKLSKLKTKKFSLRLKTKERLVERTLHKTTSFDLKAEFYGEMWLDSNSAFVQRHIKAYGSSVKTTASVVEDSQHHSWPRFSSDEYRTAKQHQFTQISSYQCTNLETNELNSAQSFKNKHTFNLVQRFKYTSILDISAATHNNSISDILNVKKILENP
jgi:hypothetical protein